MSSLFIELSYQKIKDELYRIKITIPREGFEEAVKKAFVEFANKDFKLRFSGPVKTSKKELLALVLSSHSDYGFDGKYNPHSVIKDLRLLLDQAYVEAIGTKSS